MPRAQRALAVSNVRNIVAVFSLSRISSLEDISVLSGAIYEPEQFPGVILKDDKKNATYLIFQSGKVVILGIKTLEELKIAVKNLVKILSNK
ncbi:MAG: hypothetical protein ACTSQY_07010 [Candidatus Odinarchaeia archaeon]